MYNNGPLFASLAYETHSGGVAGSTSTQELDAWKAGLGYTFGNAKVGFVYEDMDHDAANNRNSRSAWYLNGAYTMGNIVLKAAYGDADASDAAVSAATEDGATFWVIGADYVLSKRSLVFAQYGSIDNDVAAKYRTNFNSAVTGKEVDTFSLGIKHTF
jgi:predicted porin